MNSARTLRVAFWLAIAAMAFFAMAASSPQCARSTDNPVTPALGTLEAGGNACVQGCIDAFQLAKKDEQARFKAAMAACNGDYGCRAEQSMIHDMIVAELVMDKDACVLDCEHQQGTAVGGQ